MKLIKALVVIACLSFSSLSIQAEEVDINHATAEMLAKSLKGIGIKKAEAIVLYRKKHGMFEKLEDLVNVKGIGEKTLSMNKNNIILGKKKSEKK